MGLLDNLGGILGGQGGNADHVKAILAWVEQQGGISALVENFKAKGSAVSLSHGLAAVTTNPFPANKSRMCLALNPSPRLQAL